MSLEAIANQLAVLYIERGDLQHDRVFCKSRMAEIELDLLKDGVEGKNEEIRRLTRANILLSDDEWRNLDRIGRDNEAQLFKIDAQIAAFEAQRRAIEWQIRADFVGYGQRHYADATDFDSVADTTMDEFPPELLELEAALDRQYESL